MIIKFFIYLLYVFIIESYAPGIDINLQLLFANFFIKLCLSFVFMYVDFKKFNLIVDFFKKEKITIKNPLNLIKFFFKLLITIFLMIIFVKYFKI